MATIVFKSYAIMFYFLDTKSILISLPVYGVHKGFYNNIKLYTEKGKCFKNYLYTEKGKCFKFRISKILSGNSYI